MTKLLTALILAPMGPAVFALHANWSIISLNCTKTSGAYPASTLVTTGLYNVESRQVGEGRKSGLDQLGYEKQFLLRDASYGNQVTMIKFKKAGRFFDSSTFRCSF